MAYYTACELLADNGNPSGLFHYTVRDDGGTYAIGYCAGSCPGHATPGEADGHYKAYALDHQLRLDVFHPTEMHRCEVAGCEAFSQRYVVVEGLHTYWLCDRHRTRDVVATLFWPAIPEYRGDGASGAV